MIFFLICGSCQIAAAAVNGQPEMTEEARLAKRMILYKNIETAMQIPWYYMAAIDQYEHSLRNSRRDLEKAKGAIGIYVPPELWSGIMNPNKSDNNPLSISFFEGIGQDGNGDGKADVNNDEDVLYSVANHILAYGADEDNFRIALWKYYKRDKAVGIIMGNAVLFKKYGRIDLQEKAFPVPVRTHYSYRSTWGAGRGWGGRRIHEGTDIFADYGLPVRSTCYGIIEMKGWNKYGGWRVGIRDINNTYHYFAHLSGFKGGLKVGQIVEPGMVIGGVGSTGYGPPGTSGKFPPHLHYGMYKDNGFIEWSFDPTPHLRVWERKDLAKRRQANHANR
ncbi:M23 family metallopeptidase [Bacillus sp. V5-8f]|uniref:M23 family metallopeptidase n=1 Tax=Bacillus sp. V5-8f TaxID=2053044 RepID=UPI000C781993|nr:M23 family metallopeptidase [Bacillus sp. V5-8f]PLT34090.1 peptidase M23 [Bacillus sp. V5-8f]